MGVDMYIMYTGQAGVLNLIDIEQMDECKLFVL